MDKYTHYISESLITKYGFIVENYCFNLDNTQKSMLLKYMDDGVYAVIFSHTSDEQYNLELARNYLNNKNMNYNLNTVVFASEDNFISNSHDLNKRIVIDLRSKSIISANVSSEALIDVVNQSLIKNNPFNFSKDIFPSISKKYAEIPITFTLALINIIMFLISAFFSGNFSNINAGVLVFLGAKYNPLIESGQIYRLLTSTFLHGGLLHLAFNMYSLYIIGGTIEKIYGKYKYLAVYLISGITGSILSFLFSNSISVGASGSIFGLFGAALIFSIKLKDIVNKSFLNNIIGVIAINLILGFSSADIDNLGHIGGLLGGIILSLILFNKDEMLSNLRKRL